jgi:cobalt-zinc-cadmium efflux system outer membrane protein
VAAAELRAVRRDLVARTVDLAADAKLRLYDAADAGARLALRRTIAETATAAAELARRLHQAGNLTDLALVRDDLFEEDALIALRGAEADAAAAREAVNAVLGLHGAQTGWRLGDRILEAPMPAIDVGDLEREAVAASLELDAARARLEAGGGRVALARFESFVPHLAAGISAVREGEEGWHLGPAFGLSLPLFDWGQGKRAAAWATVRREQHRYAALAIELRATARAVRERVLAGEEQLSRIRDRLMPLRERLIEESVKQYNAMQLGPFELLQIRREQIDIEERHIDALRNAWAARTAAWQLRAGSRPTLTTGGAERPSGSDGH